MAMQMQTSHLEVFSQENFQGIKYTFKRGTALLPEKTNFGVYNISVKVTGDKSWKFFANAGFRGNSFQLEKGQYSRLPVADIKGIFSIKSVAPVTNTGLDIELPAGDVYDDPLACLGAWFLGPKGENVNFFVDAAELAFRMNCQFRRDFFPVDPVYITEEVKQSEACKQEKQQLMTELRKVCEELQNSVHWGSIRYQAHQVPDPSMPAVLGYLAAILYDQNNVANEGSPVTTMMEIQCCQEMCKMLGYGGEDMPVPWGAMTAGGSVANIEALWASRNLKFQPLAIQEGLKDDRLGKARNCEVYIPMLGKKKKVPTATLR